MASLEELRAERLKKLAALQAEGVNPYPIESKPSFDLQTALAKFTALADSGKAVTLVGRVRAIRDQGAIIFFDFDDGTASCQGLLKKEAVAEADFDRFQDLVDIGDFVEVTGNLFLTKRSEKTIALQSWRLLAKSLRPLPDEWSGFSDVDERFRRRYLDSLMSREVKERFIFRSKLISAIRSFLDQAGYLEVETPVLQTQAGGASAKPFVTHHEALDLDLYLRISEELYLKRMLVGGYPRVYSLAKNFRNEGIDVTHNPEFTMLEFYAAYSTAKAERAFVEKLLKTLLKKLKVGTSFHYQGELINLTEKFKVVSYFDLLKRYALIPDPAHASVEDLRLKAGQLGAKIEPGVGREKLLDAIYKKVIRPKLIQPTFVIDYPKDYLPLAKKQAENPDLVDAFQLVIGGVEVVKAFSELNDPLDQAARFAEQEKQRQAGDSEAQAMDQDFVEALEYGMPPAGGVGIGIDRLVMLLTDTHNIREVIYFPTLRPR